jgi:hypothetical protein
MNEIRIDGAEMERKMFLMLKNRPDNYFQFREDMECMEETYIKW